MTIDEAKKIGYGDFNWASVSKDKRDYLLGIARGYLMGWNARGEKDIEAVMIHNNFHADGNCLKCRVLNEEILNLSVKEEE